MTVLHVWPLWLLPLALLPFLLNRRTPPAGRRLVSALHLWPVTPPPTARAPRPARLRFDGRRALFAVLLALTVIALAEPQWGARPAGLVLVVETSTTLGARVGGVTRLAQARERAWAALQSEVATTGRAPVVHVLTAGAHLTDLGRFAADSAGLRTTLSAITPSSTAADLDAAVDAAAATEPGAPVWAIADRVVPVTARSFVPDPAGPNLAISALAAEALSDGTIAVTAAIENTAREPRRGALALLTPDAAVVSDTVTIEAGASRVVTRTVRSTATTVEARLTPEGDDALTIDNARVAVVERPATVRVRIAGEAGPFVAAALAAQPLVRLVEADEDVLVCRCSARTTPGAPGVLELPGSDAHTETPARVRVSGPAHPVTAGLAALTAAAAIAAPETHGAVLVQAGETPLLLVDDSTGRRIVRLAGDVSAPALGQSPFFAVLLANAVEWLAAHENPRTLVAGTPLRWWVGPVSTASLVGPEGRTRPARLEQGWLVATATDEPGLYVVRTPRGDAPVAVTPASAAPGDASATAPASATPEAPTAAAAATRIPLARGALLLALLLALLEWRLWPRVPAALWPRVVTVAGLALGCLGLVVPFGRAPVHVVFAVDRSDSVSPRSQQAALAFAANASRHLAPGDTVGLVTFGERPLIRRARAAAPLTPDANLRVEPGSTGSNLARALSGALALLPSTGSGRLVLVTDGHETVGRAVEAAAAAATRRVAIDVLPTESRTVLPLVRSVHAPPEVHSGEPFAVDVLASGPAGGTALVTVTGGDAPLTQEATFGAEGTALLRFTLRRSEPGITVVRARAGDEPETTAPGAPVTVVGPARLLLVTSSTDRAPIALVAPGTTVDRVAASAVPTSEAGLAGYQLVVLDRVPGERLSDAAAAALADWVEHGGGLVVLGDAASLPAGGFARPRIDALLPADLRVAPGARTPATATVVALDKSGSMADTVGGLQKIEAARQAVRLVSRALAPEDALGVIAFDLRASGVIALGPAGRSRDIDAALSALTPGGATRLAPAVELAASWLRRSGAARRHLLVVSDGRTSPDDLARAGAMAAESGLTLSVIAVGADADRAGLEAAATRTGGRAYFPNQLAELPRLAAGDVVQSRGGATVNAPVPLRAPGGHAVLAGLPLDTLPRVGGYVVAATRPGAETLLESSLSDPVLITGQAGLGRVALFTTDLGGAWSDALRRWPGYPTLLAQTLRWTSRQDAMGGMEVSVEDDAGRATLNVRLADGVPSVAPHATLQTSEGQVRRLTLYPVTSRLFTAVMPDGESALSRLEVASGTGDARVIRGVLPQPDRERAATGVNEALVTELTSMTGGRRLTADADPFAMPRPLDVRPARPVPELVALGAVLVLAAGGVRRRTGVAGEDVAA